MYQNEDSFGVGYAIGRDSNNNNNNGWNDWSWIIALALIGGLFNNGGFGFGGFGGGRGAVGGELSGWQLGRLATTNDVASGFSTSEIMSDLNDIILGQAQMQNFINQGFAGLQTTITSGNANIISSINSGFAGVDRAVCTLGYQNQTGFNALSREFADCCCKTQRAIDGVNYNMATQFGGLNNTLCNLGRDIIENQNANYRAIHEELVASKLEAKNDRIAELQDKLYKADLRASQAQQSNYITDTIINKLSPCPNPAYIVPNPNCCYNYGVYPTNNGCSASVV